MVSVGFLNGESNRIVWLLLSCVQAHRDTRFNEKTAKLPRRPRVPEGSEGAGGGIHQRWSETLVFLLFLLPTAWKQSQSEVPLQVFASEAARAKVEHL